MMKQPIFFLALLLILFFSSCDNQTGKSKEEVKTYFDIKNYFLQQAKLLSDGNVYLKKKIIKDGKTEEKLFSIVDWQKELKPFSDCNINKPAWAHSYVADTLFSEGKLSVKYITRDITLPIKEIKLNFENNRLVRMFIHKQTSNSYYTAKNDYVFETDSGFVITGLQEVMLADKTIYSIAAKFVR